jgi:hypothetical protein
MIGGARWAHQRRSRVSRARRAALLIVSVITTLVVGYRRLPLRVGRRA